MSTRQKLDRCIRSEEHTSELQSHGLISYAVFCLKKKNRRIVLSWNAALLGDFLKRHARRPLVFTMPPVNDTLFFFFNDTATTEIYTRPYTLSLHDALPISVHPRRDAVHRADERPPAPADHPKTKRSEEHTSELQSHGLISYAVFCLKK